MQRPAFVVRRAKPIPVAHDVDGTGRCGEDLPDLIGCRVHGVPGIAVVLGWVNRDEGSAHAKFVRLGAQRNPGSWIARQHLSDAANIDHDTVLVRQAQDIDRVDIRAPSGTIRPLSSCRALSSRWL